MKYISKKMFIIPIVSLLISAAVYPSLPVCRTAMLVNGSYL